MQIKNIDGLSGNQVRQLVNQGAVFVYYKYCISIVLMTFNRTSDVYFIKPGESKFGQGITYFFLNLLLGWWGIPWGPIYTLGNLFSGAQDVTNEVMASYNQNDPNFGTGTNYNIPGVGSSSGSDSSGYNMPGSNSNSYNVPNSSDNNTTQNTYNVPRQ
jgi:hypothetical protein